MRSIYSKAERVIGWLGPDENGGGQALKTLDALFRNTICYLDDFEWVRKMPELLTVSGTYTTASGTKFQSNDRLEKLLLLLKRPFWKRIWIVQELVLSLHLRLVCGEEFMDIPEPESFYNTVEKLRKIPTKRPNSLPLNMWMRLNECIALLHLVATLRCRHLHREDQADRIWKGISGFMTARVLLESHKASDPRDHIYGLLGLIDLDIVPEYGEDVTLTDIFFEVAQHCLKAEPLDILSHAGIRHSYNGADHLAPLDLPSWVPDWRLPVPARIRIHRYPQSHAFPSKGGLQMQVVDHDRLRGSAVVWDTVSRTESKTGWDLNEWDLAEKIDLENPSDRAYPSGTSRFKALVVLWLGGYNGSKTSMCDLQQDSELFRSYETIYFANIAQPRANRHGQHEMPKLVRFLFEQRCLTSVPNSHRESYVARSRQVRYDMRCFNTERGYIGLRPLATNVGDLICVLEGHKAPVILRRRSSHYLLAGDCDVVGIMNGEILEVVKRGEAEITEIEIR